MIPMGVILLWYFTAPGSVVVPSVWSVVQILIHPFREPLCLDSTSLADGAAVSVLRMLCGFLLAVITGIPVGLLIGRSRTGREILAPVTAVAMAISPIAWIPITIIVFGLSSPATAVYGQNAWQHGVLDQLRFAIIAVIWMGAFFPIVLNTASGAQHVRQSHIEAATVLGAGKFAVLTKIVLPSASPAIFTGLRLAGGIAWRVIIAAEIFPGTRGGLGYMIAVAHETASYEYAFASIIVIGLIGLCFDAVLRLASLRSTRWMVQER